MPRRWISCEVWKRKCSCNSELLRPLSNLGKSLTILDDRSEVRRGVGMYRTKPFDCDSHCLLLMSISALTFSSSCRTVNSKIFNFQELRCRCTCAKRLVPPFSEVIRSSKKNHSNDLVTGLSASTVITETASRTCILVSTLLGASNEAFSLAVAGFDNVQETPRKLPVEQLRRSVIWPSSSG